MTPIELSLAIAFGLFGAFWLITGSMHVIERIGDWRGTYRRQTEHLR
jgi:hypothetical protein